MIDTKLKGFYQSLILGPILSSSIIKRWNPHSLTFCGLILGVGSAAILSLNHPLLASIFLILSGFFDTLDGSLARFQKKSSSKGAALDITSDRLVEFAIILALFLYDPSSRGLLCLLMLGSVLFCITTFLVVGIFTEKESDKSFYYSPGLIERSEAFFFFIAMILVPPFFVPLAIVFVILVTWTGAIRIRQFMKNG